MTKNGNGNHKNLEHSWKTDLRWEGITRPYSAKDVEQLRGSVHIEHTLARMGAERLWQLLQDDLYVSALGALTGNQAVQQVGRRTESHLHERLASSGRRQRCRANVS